jgi:uncharacterized protein (TIGR04255 family)
MTIENLDTLHYETPPINEVVCGLMFEPLKELLAPHLGLLWERYKPDFATCKQQPPLAIQLETPEGTLTEAQVIFDEAPLPRVWFEETSGNGLIQVQRDRFHYNWRRVNSDDEYPHFDKVFGLFTEKLETFQRFVREIGCGELSIKQYELTYVNQILLGEGWHSVADIGDVFCDFSWKQDKDRMQPEALNWRVTFPLPVGMGRLHAAVRSAVRNSDKKQILLFDLTARGGTEDRAVEKMQSWFVGSHNAIVRAFVEMTTQRIQKELWKLQK